MDSTIRDQGRQMIAWVDDSMVVLNTPMRPAVGRVARGGDGTIKAPPWEGAEDLMFECGRVDPQGRVRDNNGDDVGWVTADRVYDKGHRLVGTVEVPADSPRWVTGINETHKAGAALLLVVLPALAKNRRWTSEWE